MVEGAVAQHREQHVAAPSGKSDEPSENGLSTTVVFNSIFGIAYASYLLTITYGALRWRLNFPTRRQRNLLAVLGALEVPAQGPNKGTICAV